MTISATSIFDIGNKQTMVHDGIELFRGWHKASSAKWSRDRNSSLRINASKFPEPITLAVKIRVFNPDTTPPKTLKITSDGHKPFDVTILDTATQTVLIQTPVIPPEDTEAFIKMELSSCESPAKLGLSTDDRLLGFEILSILENPATPSFPIDVRKAPAEGTAHPVTPLLTSGWAQIEEDLGVWSLTTTPQIVLPGYFDLSKAKAIAFTLNTLPRPEGYTPFQVELWHADQWLAVWDFEESNHGTYSCPLDQLEPSVDFEITFRMNDLASPAMLGINADPRMLGIMIQSIELET